MHDWSMSFANKIIQILIQNYWKYITRKWNSLVWCIFLQFILTVDNDELNIGINILFFSSGKLNWDCYRFHLHFLHFWTFLCLYLIPFNFRLPLIYAPFFRPPPPSQKSHISHLITSLTHFFIGNSIFHVRLDLLTKFWKMSLKVP